MRIGSSVFGCGWAAFLAPKELSLDLDWIERIESIQCTQIRILFVFSLSISSILFGLNIVESIDLHVLGMKIKRNICWNQPSLQM